MGHAFTSIGRRAERGDLPDDLRDWLAQSTTRRTKLQVETWRVTDDWPDRVPVTSAEVAVFEAWFGDIFDELFGPTL